MCVRRTEDWGEHNINRKWRVTTLIAFVYVDNIT